MTRKFECLCKVFAILSAIIATVIPIYCIIQCAEMCDCPNPKIKNCKLFILIVIEALVLFMLFVCCLFYCCSDADEIDLRNKKLEELIKIRNDLQIPQNRIIKYEKTIEKNKDITKTYSRKKNPNDELYKQVVDAISEV